MIHLTFIQNFQAATYKLTDPKQNSPATVNKTAGNTEKFEQ